MICPVLERLCVVGGGDAPDGAGTLGVLSRMLTLAEVWEMRPEGVNPCRHVKKYPEHKRERFLSDDEYRRLGAALRDAEREGMHPPFG